MHDEYIHHTRTIYDVLALFGDVGGLLSVIELLAALIFTSLSEHRLLIKLLTELFRVKSDQQRKKSAKVHIGTCKALGLYFQRLLEQLTCGLCDFSDDLQNRFIARAESIAEKELDIARLIKITRRFNALFK